MSTRVSRKSTVSSSSTTHTPQAGSSINHGRPTSPLSPTRISRIQEKEELQGLNDRLADYIDRVRQLELENNKLRREVHTIDEIKKSEVTNVKVMFEQELSELRKSLDELAGNNAKLEVDRQKLIEENQDLKSKLDKKTKDLLLLERSFSIVQNERDDLNKKCNQLRHERDKLSTNLRDLELEHEKLLKLLEDKTNRLNEETILRVELENTVTTLKEDLEFKRNMYEQTLKESTTRRLIEISEVDAGVADYEARLKIDLQETRQLYEQQMEENRKEMEELFRQQLKDMNLDSIRDADVANIRLEELHQMRTRMESANKIIADLEAQNASLSARMRDLEQTLEMERIAHAEDKTVLIREIDTLRSKLAENMREFQELLNVKVSLDAEISTYRSLLKNEEHRLNISPGGSSSGSAVRSSQFQQQTPIRRGTPQRGAKRKRTTLEESASLSESNYRVSSKATGDIEIIEVCSEGKFVKLYNKGNKEIILSGWQIHRVAGEEETTFKFHRSVKMEPDVTITVWSSDAGQTHEPPTNIVMKGQRWFVADNMTTTLINSSAEEVARSERERQQLSSMSSHLRETSGGFASTSRFEGEDIFHQKGDPPAGKDETCRLM